MSDNASLNDLLTLEDLGLPSSAEYPASVFGSLFYMLIITFNCVVILAIATSKRLHKPMYLLLCNLPVSDMLGASAFLPHMLFSITTKNRTISYDACMIQAFLIHFYGTANLLTLSAMAYDRYVAICNPLRYHTIMTAHTLVTLIVSVWFSDVAIMGTLMAMNLRHKICRTHIVDLYCNNPSLLKLSCGSTLINNYYGLFNIALLQGGSMLVIVYTYAQIFRMCAMTKQVEVRRKAAQTCVSHLLSFFLLQINTIITLTAHRIRGASPLLRRSMGVSVIIFPPFFDPIIYGLSSKELKTAILLLLRSKGKGSKNVQLTRKQ